MTQYLISTANQFMGALLLQRIFKFHKYETITYITFVSTQKLNHPPPPPNNQYIVVHKYLLNPGLESEQKQLKSQTFTDIRAP